MAFDQPKLLLLANVITITAVTALSLMWLLRKKDQQRLIGALNVGREPERQRPEIPMAPPPPSNPGRDATQVVPPPMDRDIREFVSRRAQGWSAPSVAQWNKRLNADPQPGLRRVAGAGDPIEPSLPRSEQILFPSQVPSPATLHRLAAPIQLCRDATAARFGNVFYSKDSEGTSLPGGH